MDARLARFVGFEPVITEWERERLLCLCASSILIINFRLIIDINNKQQAVTKPGTGSSLELRA